MRKDGTWLAAMKAHPESGRVGALPAAPAPQEVK